MEIFPVRLKSVRIFWAITVGFLKRYQKQFVTAFSIAVVSFIVLYFVSATLFLRQYQRFTEGMVGEYTTQTLPKVVTDLSSFGLTKLLPDGEAIPGAALSWEVTNDGKRYTFHLDPNLQWQDGKPFSASDISSLFEDLQTQVLDPHTIQFTLKAPYSPFPVLLAKPLYRGNNLIGLGPWKITDLEKQGNYISVVTLTNNRSTGEKNITFRFYPTIATLVTAYKLGELSAMMGIFPDAILPSKWNTATIEKQVSHTTQVTLFFNVRDNILADKNVREALSYAVEKNTMPGEAAFSPIPPNSWAFNPDIKQYVFDTNHAKELLKLAQLPAGTPLTLSATSQTMSVAQQIAKSWQGLGFTVTVVQVSDVPKTFQAIVLMQEIPADPDQYATWDSLEKNTNISGYSQIRVDKLLEDGRTIQDTAIRKQKYFNFQRFLVEDDPALFLYYPYTTLYLNKRFDTAFYRQLNGF